MKLCYLIFVTIFTTYASAWTAIGNYHNDANPGMCTISDALIIKPGETVKDPTQCANISCHDEEGNGSIYGCGAMMPPDNCIWGEPLDINAPYPECCERQLICKEPENLTNQQKYQENKKSLMESKNSVPHEVKFNSLYKDNLKNNAFLYTNKI